MLLPTLGVGTVLFQPVVPLPLYSIVAPVSAPLTVTAPLLVILSVPLAPVSAVSATVGAVAVTSIVSAKFAEATLLFPPLSVMVDVRLYEPLASWLAVTSI